METQRTFTVANQEAKSYYAHFRGDIRKEYANLRLNRLHAHEDHDKVTLICPLAQKWEEVEYERKTWITITDHGDGWVLFVRATPIALRGTPGEGFYPGYMDYADAYAELCQVIEEDSLNIPLKYRIEAAKILLGFELVEDVYLSPDYD